MLNVILLLSFEKLKKQEMLAVLKMKLKEEMDRKKKRRSGRDSAGPAPATPQY